jgi:hypothetical protein
MDFPQTRGSSLSSRQSAGTVGRVTNLRFIPFTGNFSMRLIVPLALASLLSGCGYNTWWNPPFTTGFNPNRPASSSENMERALGHEPSVSPLKTEIASIWPGPVPPPTTLKDLQDVGVTASQPGTAVTPDSGTRYPSPQPVMGSGTPPGSAQPNPSKRSAMPPVPSYAQPPAAPPAPGQAGQVIQTQEGPAVTTGGGSAYQTTTNPGGGQSIVVPNGNGTSTVIHPDGRIETIPTPK